MSFDQARAAAFDAFKTEFGTAYPAVKIYFENQPFKQPVGEDWVSIAFIPNVSQRANIGTTKNFHHYGVLNVNVYVRENTGTALMHAMADKVFTILCDRDWSLADGKLTTYGAERRTRGLMNGFYIHNVQCEFCLDASLER